jgi:hypothetical protein
MMSASSAVWSDGEGATGSTTSQHHPSILLALPGIDPAGSSMHGSHFTDCRLGIGATKMGQGASLSTAEALGIVVRETAWRDDVAISTASCWSSHGGANGQCKPNCRKLHPL